MARIAYVSLELEEPREEVPEERPVEQRLSWWRCLVRWLLRKVEGDA